MTRSLDPALLARLDRRFAGQPNFNTWLARQSVAIAVMEEPAEPYPRPHYDYVADPELQKPIRLWEVAIVYRDGRPDNVLTPPGGVPEEEAISVYRTYRDTVDRAEGVVGTFPAREG
ncbi:hypothetical protein FV226_13190 [Methylobacterium sp. WL12]|uniref:hypothetical protein n=1 Tax=Methylobacterium sp. WL12 TaxID=2603890 RepID=UPI0011CBC5DC|nr:hypothetical protein [Methylobacterium sp. WL12]TXM72178.1 hypothetical protein FV226_13190 [Methylobacterium sp. WL12]